MSNPIIESFSVSHAAILDGQSEADFSDIYGIRTGTIEIDADSFSNTGNDQIMSFWNWFNSATVTIETGYISFDTVTKVTDTSFTFNAGTYELLLWSQDSLNVRPFPLLVRCPAKDQDGNTGVLDIVLFRVNPGPFKFEGPSYKSGLSVSFTGQAVMSEKDELGIPLTEPAVGKMIYRAGQVLTVGAEFVHNNSDGTFTITDPDLINEGFGIFTLTSDAVHDNGDGTYTITY